MRVIWVALVAALAAGCASVGYQSFADGGKVYEGNGGIKLEVDGVDIWTSGAPPRRYSIIGVAMQQASGPSGEEAAARVAVAKLAKERGADAAIQVQGNPALKGIVNPAQDISAGTGVRRLQYALIKYVP